MSEKIIIALIQSMPVAIIVVMLIFFSDIKKLLAKVYINSISIAGLTFDVDSKTIKELADFLTEAMNESITSDEWHVFSKIASFIDNPNYNTVKEILGWELDRDENGVANNDETKANLKKLRALRGFGLILPERKHTQLKPRWDSNSNIIVTDFGKYVAKHPVLCKIIKQNA